ncbi:MAG: extracellular solute-binding protein [Acidobacteriaceae bacterium]
MIRLRGMTWKHDRGLVPMIATAARFHESHPDVVIEWEARSLSEFGEAPVESLAEQYNLVVLDHPNMGALARAGCFLPLDEHLPAAQIAGFARNTTGSSHASYEYDGHLWALAIDAAAQVAGYRADLLEREGARLPQTWDDVFELARVRTGFVSLPLWPLDSLMCFFTLCANAGDPAFASEGILVSRETGQYALDLLRCLRDCSAPEARSENPIAVWERMSATDQVAYCPLAFGYSNYARPGYRSRLLSFGAIPSAGRGPVGATLGGAGLAISARWPHRDIALEYAAWVAGADCQRTLYVESGGQPAAHSAWTDPAANALAKGYFRATLPVLEQAWLRPRFPGFVGYQNRAADIIRDFLSDKRTSGEALDELDRLLRVCRVAHSSPPLA